MIVLEENKTKPEAPSPYKPKPYKIKHIVWRQRELLYPDTEPLLAILAVLGDEFKNSFTETESKFFEFAQKLFEKKLLPQLFAIILEPDNRNPFRALLNKFWMKRFNLNAGNVINVMTTAQWRAVLADFFIESSQWIQSWLHSTGVSEFGSSEKNYGSSVSNLLMTILKPLMNPLEPKNASTIPVVGATVNTLNSETAPN